jgi:hypothetical protein
VKLDPVKVIVVPPPSGPLTGKMEFNTGFGILYSVPEYDANSVPSRDLMTNRGARVGLLGPVMHSIEEELAFRIEHGTLFKLTLIDSGKSLPEIVIFSPPRTDTDNGLKEEIVGFFFGVDVEVYGLTGVFLIGGGMSGFFSLQATSDAHTTDKLKTLKLLIT